MADVSSQQSIHGNAPDGTLVADIYGNVFRYDLSVDSWINEGLQLQSGVVDERENGFVDPSLFMTLSKIQNLIELGVD